MNIVLKSRMNGKTREECAKIAGVSIQKITHWYNEGKQGFGKDNKYFYKALTQIENNLEHTIKYEKEIEIYNRSSNISKRKKFINFIRNGDTRKDASRKTSLDLKFVTRWDSLGRSGIKPFTNFHRDYANARNHATQKENREKERIKRDTVNLIKQGLSLKDAAKKVDNGKHEKTIINWYNAGRLGDKNHTAFYRQCESVKKPPVNTDIFAPLPPKWVEHFRKLPMNKTGIAWVNRIGNNWIYQRQINCEIVKYANPDIRKLHKEVIKNNHIWGIRDLTLARQVINGNVPINPTTTVSKPEVTAKLIRTTKNTFNAIIQGYVENKEVKKILKAFEFYELDIEKMETKRVKGKTEILIELNLNISLLNSFEETIKDLGWKIIK